MLRILIVTLFFVFNLSTSAETVVLNAASLGHEPATITQIAPGSIAVFRGTAMGTNSVADTTVKVNGASAKVFYATPEEVQFVVPDDLAAGPVQIVITNAEGVASQAEVMIKRSAPGVFTVSGNGQGEGIILDADLMTIGPFRPTGGSKRLSIFATGVRHAQNVAVTINGNQITVETVAPSGLAGIDEIHVLLPTTLSGAGTATLIVDADGVQSNPVSLSIGGTPSAPPKIVINQVFGGGGNSGAPFRNDFIEIFNAGNTSVNLSGWSIQYASATATTWSTTPLTSVVLSPGQYYLVQQAGGNNGATLPTPDVTGTIAMAAGSGKVALVKNTTALTGACPNDPNIVDVVGYGSTATCFRGSGPAPGASNTNAAARKTNGCTDTQNNASDFSLAAPNPRNTTAPLNPCTIAKSVLPSFADAFAKRRSHNFAPTLRLRRFP
ncbi:MAG TPA: lamin tail domain-containing protein [Pyrinomonadaceae bacterium]|nr:lamin tail domain-containing protein [Pyrinomonadaceae bacterium]